MFSVSSLDNWIGSQWGGQISNYEIAPAASRAKLWLKYVIHYFRNSSDFHIVQLEDTPSPSLWAVPLWLAVTCQALSLLIQQMSWDGKYLFLWWLQQWSLVFTLTASKYCLIVKIKSSFLCSTVNCAGYPITALLWSNAWASAQPCLLCRACGGILGKHFWGCLLQELSWKDFVPDI